MAVPGGELILTTALKSLVGKIVGVVFGKVGDAIEPALLQRAVEEAVSNATNEAARTVGRPGAEALADSLVEKTGDIVLRILKEQRGVISNSEDLEEFERSFLSAYPDDLDETIAAFSRKEAQIFLDAFLKALDDNTWSKEPLRSLRESASQRFVEEAVGDIRQKLVPETDTTKILERAIVASSSDLEKFWVANRKPLSLVERTMMFELGETSDRIGRAELLKRIRPGWRARLVAEPGAGKTTWLLSVAESLLSEVKLLVPVLLPLNQISHGQSVVSVLIQRAAFEKGGISENEIRKLASEGHLTLICDGWNELSSDERRIADIELSNLVRDYPNVALLIATRPSVSAPRFRNNETIYLTPVTAQQQYEYVKDTRGEDGVEALRIAKGNENFSDLFQNPLFLSIFAELDYSEALPTNRESLIERFVSAEESKDYNREQLRAFFAETHRDYLISIAAHLTSQGTTQGSLSELRPVVLARARALSDTGQLSVLPILADVLENLSSHTNLCRSMDEADSVYRFQHHQFQEWFASHVAEDAILNAYDTKGAPPSSAAREFADRVLWEEAVLFAIERLSCGDERQRGAAARFVCETVGVDPEFSGQMIARVSEEVWGLVQGPISRFIEDWRAHGHLVDVISFILLTGRPEFEEVVWEYLSKFDEKHHDVRFSWDRRFDPRVLGEDWHRRISGLGDENRRMLAYELAYNGGEVGIGYAFDVAADDSSDELVSTVIEALLFRRRFDLAEKLLDGARESLWQRMSGSLDPEDFVSPQLKEIHQSVLHGLLERETDPEKKLRYSFMLLDYKDEPEIGDLIRQVLDTKSDNSWAAHEWLTRLSKIDPNAVSEEIVERIVGGKQLPFHATDFVTALSEDQEEATVEAVRVSRIQGSTASSIAIHFSPIRVAALVARTLELHGEVSASSPAAKDKVDRYREYNDLVLACDASALVSALIEHPTIESKEISLLCDLINLWGGPDSRQGPFPVESDLLPELVKKVRDWGGRLIEEPQVSRRSLATVAEAIGRIGVTSLVPVLKEIVDKELDLHQAELAAVEKAGRKRHLLQDNWAHMYYDNQLGRAFDGVQGDEACGVLVSYLSDSRFSRAAARALVSYCPQPTAHIANENNLRNFAPSVLKARRSAREALHGLSAPNAVAGLVLARIEDLLSDSGKAAVLEAFDLARSLALMDYGNRRDVFDRVLAEALAPRAKCDLLRALSNAGETISADQILPGLAAAEEEYFKAKWHSQNDFWILAEWLELLAASDDPSQLVKHWGAYPELERSNYRLRDLIAFLELAPDDKGLSALVGLGKSEPSVRESHQWMQSICRMGTTDAGTVLLDEFFTREGATQRMHSMSEPVMALARLLKREKELRKYAFDLYDNADNTGGPRALQLIFRDIGDEEAFFEVVDRISDQSDCPMFQLALAMLRGLCQERRPIDGSSNSFELLSTSVASIRQRLWSMGESAPAKRANIDRLLRAVDESRRELGGNSEDPRHPDLSTGRPWPRFAEPVWEQLAGDN